MCVEIVTVYLGEMVHTYVAIECGNFESRLEKCSKARSLLSPFSSTIRHGRCIDTAQIIRDVGRLCDMCLALGDEDPFYLNRLQGGHRPHPVYFNRPATPPTPPASQKKTSSPMLPPSQPESPQEQLEEATRPRMRTAKRIRSFIGRPSSRASPGIQHAGTEPSFGSR